MEVLTVDGLTVRHAGKTVINQISFTIVPGEQWAIVGPSGSGKTFLLKALAGKIFNSGHVTFHENNVSPGKKVVLVEQQHHFKNLSNTSNFYYQQRFNSQDSEDTLTVEEDLQQQLLRSKAGKEKLNQLAVLFDIKRLYSERLIQLSNGENKRVQIVKALLLQPAFLLLDNPFTGLDGNSRKMLEETLDEIGKDGIRIIMVTSPAHIPFFITHVISLTNDITHTVEAVDPARWNKRQQEKRIASSVDETLLQQLTSSSKNNTFEFAVRMKNVSIRYDHLILDSIHWEVRNGERWSLSGPNGSGKSTLLSLVNADNPQAYANEIYLFDRKRGSGETIWDIKQKIGFVSPELHLYFEKGTSSFDVVASGLFDTIGLFRKLNGQQATLVSSWMRLLRIEYLQRKFLNQLSNSEQRLVLLARALVKNPPMLILDEPCQGLDEEQTELFKEIIHNLCITGNKTLIYVSHYTHDIPACVTQFIRLENGKRVQ